MGKGEGKARLDPSCKNRDDKQTVLCQFKVLAVYQEKLGDMTEQDAWEEGGYTLDSYKETFQIIYGF